MARRVVHVVLGDDIVLDAYWRADVAIRHARCITGADVVSLEVRDEIPPEIRADIEFEWESDEETPRVVDIDDIDDAV